MGDVDQELVAGAHGVRQADWRGPITLDEHIIGRTGNAIRAHHHDLGRPLGPLMKLP